MINKITYTLLEGVQITSKSYKDKLQQAQSNLKKNSNNKILPNLVLRKLFIYLLLNIFAFVSQQISELYQSQKYSRQMIKQEVNYDPDFEIKGDKIIVQARSTLCSLKRPYLKFNKMKWDFKEQKVYNLFVISNKELFSDTKHNKIFFLMSKKVITRDARQCQTHHTKMLKRNKFYFEVLAQNCCKELQSQKKQQELNKQEQQKQKPHQASNQFNVDNSQLTQQSRTSEPENLFFELQSLKFQLDQDLFSVLNLECTVQQQNSFAYQ